MKMSVEQRLDKSGSSNVTKKLFNILVEKQSNLCVAVDVTKAEDLLKLADLLGPKICALKTHVDIIQDWDSSIPEQLKMLAKKHNFLLFEDRKLADIGQTVAYQFHHGIYGISSWADLVTVHGIPGPGILDALSRAECKALIVAEMSSKGMKQKYLNKIVGIHSRNAYRLWNVE
jgi:orotidine 5'-phosphate decarboxylase subfamily 1